jgi:ribosomal protein L16 Arg81 hydroxylase
MLTEGFSSATAFPWLIHPLEPREFESRFYQREVLVVRRETPDYFNELLSLTDLDLVLATHTTRVTDISVVQANKEISASTYTDEQGNVQPLRVAQHFANGATVIFTQLHRRIPSLGRLCAALEGALSSPIQTNIYLTPPTSQGFKPHWDTHDVFVLQVTGSKDWTIYDTKIELPLRGQLFDPSKSPEITEPGPAAMEFVLSPGDMAYIPRGVMHAARSSGENSLHVTAGLMAYTWADLFLEAVAHAAVADKSLRENLPLGFARPDFPRAEGSSQYREKLAGLFDRLSSEASFQSLSRELPVHHRSSFTNLLSQMTSLSSVNLDSSVRNRQGITWDFQEEDDTCVVQHGRTELRVPRALEPALRFLRGDGRTLVRHIPDCVDEAGKIVLVRRLIKEGLMELIDDGSPLE